MHNIGLMIEDNAHYAIDLANHGIPIILLEATWNKSIDTSAHQNIFRVKSWRDIIAEL